jgi:hypothetical protein
MTTVFSAEDLRTLCFELNLDYDDLPSGGRKDKARELILLCERTGRLDDLLALCRRKRPNFDWDALSPQPTDSVGKESQAGDIDEPADIFLSYSRKDSQMKERLAQDLRQAGFSVWTDDGLVPGTSSWHQAIENQIESAGCLVVMLSPDAKASVWVRRELDYGVAQGKRIFPAMIRGT